ncbi:MAG: COX15/CtaA family protein [Chloroflexi bacterium]|nr:COX15/CtaA family protein [Chloroflexota bacterium]
MNLNRYAKYAWSVVAYNILVILWGAFVRASFSGAGCGSHWPLCNGEVVPMNPSIERIIEFTHRATSGIALVLIVVLIVWAFRAYPWGLVRKGAVATGVFIITESLLGASLVLFGWVALDRSVWRVYSMGLHLINTFLLLGAMTLTAWWASGGKAIQFRGRPTQTTLLIVALVGVVVIGVTGAITALGDTLFPAQSLAQGLRQHFDPTANFLIQLSVVHPFIAVGVSAYLWFLTVFMNRAETALTRKLGLGVRVLVIVQPIVGVTNILLLAPIWMQIVHLLLADLLWITLILYGASFLAAETTPTRESTTPRGAVNAPAE